MWILESTTQPDKNTYSILGDHKYVVGRQNCDIVVADPSVSRKQAVLTMAHYETNVAKSFVTPTLTLEDVSKFGTYVNGKSVKTAGGNTVTLKENDLIKFGGTPASVYRARYQPFLATTSCLEKGPKKALQRVMCLLGGHLVRDWRPTCDLLIMSKINVTLKVICAINNQKHIVTPKYLDDLHQHLMGHADKPDPEQYLPEVVDQEVPPGVSFHPNKQRQTLLEGLKFYFMSPLQFNKTNLAVSTAGGQPILLEDGNEEDAETMTQEGTVVVLVTKDVLETLSPASTKFVRTVMATLKRKNLRMITDPEIGTAILTCNMVDYCNPRTALAPNLQAAMASQIMSQMTDVDNSQVKAVSAALAGRDIKPEIRSLPDKQKADAQPQRKVGSHQEHFIKPEKISHSGNSASVDGEKPVTPTVDRVSPAQGNKPDRLTSPRNPETIKTTGIGKEIGTSKSAGLPSSQLSHDLFGDTSVADESSTRQSMQQLTALGNEKNNESIPSVFARQRIRKQGNSTRLSGVEDEKETSSSKQPRKFSLFDDEDSDVNESSKTKNSVASKRKFLFEDDSDEDSGHSKIQKRNLKSDPSSKSNQISKGHSQRDAGSKWSEQDDMHSSFADGVLSKAQTNIEKREETSMLCLDDDSDPENSERRADKCEPEITGGEDNPTSHAFSSVPPRLGWVSAVAKKTRINLNVGDEDDDSLVKPDTELLRDAAGNVLRNLCEVELAELVVRPAKPKSKICEDGGTKNGTQKNFKRFKKTENEGAGKLPTIIGGRDLEEHRGTVHKDLEDLFTKGLARQNDQEEEERQNRDLFDWDTKNRKASNRRIR